MFSLTHLIVYACIAILFYLLGVLGGRRSKKANAYADQLDAKARQLESEVLDLRARLRQKQADREGNGQA
ncbi:MAG: hypothetical protein ACREO4_16400 [Lysobacter sp.]